VDGSSNGSKEVFMEYFSAKRMNVLETIGMDENSIDAIAVLFQAVDQLPC
jgi:hypothetical protein